MLISISQAQLNEAKRKIIYPVTTPNTIMLQRFSTGEIG